MVSCGQDIQAILTAVNEGRLDHCLTKPLQDGLVKKTVQKELTTYIIENDSENLLSYSLVLDQQRLLRSHIEKKMRHYREGFISDHHKLSDEELAEQVISALRLFFEGNDDENACRRYSPEHLLTKEGEENRFLWFITKGEVALYKKDDIGMQREVVRYSKGNIVGGMSFVSGERSFSTAITLKPTEVIKLDRDVFAKVMHSNTDLLPLFTNLLLRHFNRRLQRSITNKLALQKTLESLENAQLQLIEREKMAMLGQLVAGVAHELNNPVAAILRGTETLVKNIDAILSSPDHQAKMENVRGDELLKAAREAKPVSTAAERERVKQLMTQVKDRRISKKMVKLNLDSDETLIKLAQKDPDQAFETLAASEHYHQVGATLRSVGVCAQRIADMVKSLKGYARPDDETFHYVDIHEGIEDTLVIFENRLKRHELEKSYSSLPQIYCQPIALQQVWTNLIANALDALPKQGKLSISTSIEHKEQKDWAVISVRDNGCGMPKEVLGQVFALNFTTKKEGNFGLGIGLSVCQQIASQHSGFVKATSNVNEYTEMQVWLPITLAPKFHEYKRSES